MSIDSVGGNSAMAGFSSMHGMRGMGRPDPTAMANELFSKLDTSGQGYIEKSDLQNAFDQMASKATGAGATPSAADLFSQLDANSDGKVTKDEFSESIKKLADQLDQQFQSGRMRAAMSSAGGMEGMGAKMGVPPGPPPGGGADHGMTKDQLSAAAEGTSGSDSGISSLLADVAKNFDVADTNKDGKVTLQETYAYEQSHGPTGSATSMTAAPEAAETTLSNDGNMLMFQIMRLAHAYGIGRESSSTSTPSFSTSA